MGFLDFPQAPKEVQRTQSDSGSFVIDEEDGEKYVECKSNFEEDEETEEVKEIPEIKEPHE